MGRTFEQAGEKLHFKWRGRLKQPRNWVDRKESLTGGVVSSREDKRLGFKLKYAEQRAVRIHVTGSQRSKTHCRLRK